VSYSNGLLYCFIENDKGPKSVTCQNKNSSKYKVKIHVDSSQCNYRMLHIKYVCSSEILNKPIIIIITIKLVHTVHKQTESQTNRQIENEYKLTHQQYKKALLSQR